MIVCNTKRMNCICNPDVQYALLSFKVAETEAGTQTCTHLFHTSFPELVNGRQCWDSKPWWTDCNFDVFYHYGVVSQTI